MESNKIKVWQKHPLAIRWTHWINFPILSLMLLSGIWIYWANPAYTPWIPQKAYHFFGLDHRLALGMGIHFLFMWIFAVNGLVYVSYLAFSGEWREIFPEKNSLLNAVKIFLHDIGFKKIIIPMGEKFNSAQKLAYSSILCMGFVSILSGIVVYKPVQAQVLGKIFLGYSGARLVHFLLAVGFILFFFVHIIQVIRAGWVNFQSMVTGEEECGYEEKSETNNPS